MNWVLLITAIMMVESNGDADAVGDNGRAVGCMQIHPCVVVDVNRLFNEEYTLEDRKNVAYSRSMALQYLIYYGGKYEAQTGNVLTYEVLARLWNGGPRGYEKQSTLAYWSRVEAKMKELQ